MWGSTDLQISAYQAPNSLNLFPFMIILCLFVVKRVAWKQDWVLCLHGQAGWYANLTRESAVELLTRTDGFSRGISSHLLLMLGRAGCGNPETEFWSWMDNGRWWEHPLPLSLRKLRETVKDREAWCAAIPRVTRTWTQHSDWTVIKPGQDTAVLNPWQPLRSRVTVLPAWGCCLEVLRSRWLRTAEVYFLTVLEVNR